MCHNPHTDVKPSDAMKSCADAGCHAELAGGRLPRGRGPPKGGPALRDLPPAARGPGGRERLHRVPHLRPPGRREAAALRSRSIRPRRLQQTFRLVEPGRSRGRGDAPPPDEAVDSSIAPTASPTDTFSHREHRRPRLHHLPHDNIPDTKAHLRAAAGVPDLPSPAPGLERLRRAATSRPSWQSRTRSPSRWRCPDSRPRSRAVPLRA